ncbi:MAG: TetR/AcrR family transcriptional regulator [Oleispira sp.]|nr:TetR/AcrR family transcriptional regulator [Oleispira sp.]MBL4880060.1 TetR/AcrR family transcriptional regulator [Oleispira sp.]
MSQKETAILDAASTLFSAKGYHAVGVDAIISQSNVAKMTFYKYFPSKEFLIESVLVRQDQKLRVNILESVARKKNAMTKIKAIFDWYEIWLSSPEFRGCMFIKASEEYPKIGTKIRAISLAHKDWLADIISSFLKDYGVSSPEPLSNLILMLLDGLTVRENMQDNLEKGHVKVAWGYTKKLITAST